MQNLCSQTGFKGARSCLLRLETILATNRPGRLYTVGYDHPQLLFLTLGRACSKELVGTHFEAWLLDHKQQILDIFGDEHPYIRKRLELGVVVSLL